MVLQIISWYKFFVRRIDGLTKTSKLQLETRPTITAIALRAQISSKGFCGRDRTCASLRRFEARDLFETLRLRDEGFGVWVSRLWFRGSGFRFQDWGLGIWNSEGFSSVPDSPVPLLRGFFSTNVSTQVSGFGIRDSGSGFGFRNSVPGLWVSGFGFGDSGFGFRDSRFGFWIWGFEIRGQVSRFRDSGFGWAEAPEREPPFQVAS